MSDPNLRPMAATDDDLRAFAECFARNDSPRADTALRWQYANNPTGKLFVDVAQSDHEFAAIYASLPVFVRAAGAPRLALQSLDTLTDARFRGKGLFVKLAKATFERATRDGAAFIYGFPNGNSAPGFFGKLGWTRLDPLPFLIRPLRSRYVVDRLRLGSAARLLPDVPLAFGRTRGLPRGLTLRSVDRFDESFSSLWADFASGVEFAVERSAAYLNWRLVDKPFERYTRLAAYDGDSLVGFVAFAVKEKHGGRVGYLMELMFRPGRARVGRALLRQAIAAMARERADVALAWCLPHSPSYSSMLRLGFLPLPERLRPIELHFGARAFDPALEARIGRRDAWYLSYLDSDTV